MFFRLSSTEKIVFPEMKLDDVLATIGEFGPYQLWVYHWYCMLNFSVAFHHLGQVFLGGVSDHWCAIPENTNCSDSTNYGCQYQHFSFKIPADDLSTSINESNCIQYVSYVNITEDTPLIECANSYEFDHSRYTSTIQEDFTLVCKGKTKVAFAQSIYFFGLLVGSVVMGSVADRIGRKPTLIICAVMQSSFGLALSFIQSFTAYCILRFIIATATIGIYLISFVMATELVGLKWRNVAGNVMPIYWSLGIMVLALFGYLVRDWRKLQIVLSVPTGVAALYMPFLPESARWLLSQGEVTKAEKIVHKFARASKVTIAEHPFGDKIQMKKERKYTALDLFRTPNLRKKTINVMYNWFVVVMVFYGLSLSTDGLGIDPYIAFMLSGLVEIPARIFSIFSIDRFGRRPMLAIVILSGGACCLITVFIEPGMYRVMVAMGGKFSFTAAFGIVYVYSAELFPTPLRTTAMGLASMAGRMGSIISPMALVISEIWKPLPLVLFSSLSVTAGLLGLLLPETKGISLPETIEEGEHFGKKTKRSKSSGYSHELQTRDDKNEDEETEIQLPFDDMKT
ncbi:organic cation transporter protein-like [Antedon mediterranea]|uniref:organic cation transporter protein-like n=1 Tax=Antedon mediterranea TaxID=105859 RepID=UPI003AF8745B